MTKTKDKYKETLGKILFGVFLFAVWIFLCASVLSYSPTELPNKVVYSQHVEHNNWVGWPGFWCACAIFNCFGVAGYFVVIAFGVSVTTYWRQGGIREPILKTIGFGLILTATAGGAAYFFDKMENAPAIGPGGCVGVLVRFLLENFCVRFGAYFALFGVFAAGGILASSDAVLRFVFWSTGLGSAFGWLTGPFRRRIEATRPDVRTNGTTNGGRENGKFNRGGVSAFNSDNWGARTDFAARRRVLPNGGGTAYSNEPNGGVNGGAWEEGRKSGDGDVWSGFNAPNVVDDREYSDNFGVPANFPAVDAIVAESKPETIAPPKRSLFGFICGGGKNAPTSEETNASNPPAFRSRSEYVYPSFDLLAGREIYDPEEVREKILARGVELERVFKSYGVDVKVVDVQTGPVLTLYEIELKAGLRVKSIHSLTSDLEIAMKAPRVRIVSPIPGKNTVGVELPNEERQLVRLREVMEERADEADKMSIPIFLGKDVVGTPMVADLATLPHLLIAGRTGTGKSVCLNSIIMSILMTRSPEDVKMILIDPKMVELSPYRSIPHLMHPVVVDMKKAEAILEWAVEKMESRYQIFAKVGARKLSEFNNMSPETLRKRLRPRDEEEWAAFPKTMPSVVIVADEMADLIMTSGKDVERHIVRLAQKSRAVGIHLVLATQKPTVDVVTGLIKSNLPARIAFGVASRTDSQVVLDAKGAEQLLGNGDMLFLLPGTSQLVRGQGTFVSDKEIDSVIEAISVDEPEFEVVIEDEEAVADDETGDVEYDEYYVAAVDSCIAEGRASTSLLQRKFSIGYNRAARIIDVMTAEGIVTPRNPAKPSQPRNILITMEQWRGRQDGGPPSSGGFGGGNFAPGPQAAPSRPSAPTVNFGAQPQNGVWGIEAARAASNLTPLAAAGTETAYRQTAYEASPVATPESKAAERAAFARTQYQEIDMTPRRSGTQAGAGIDVDAPPEPESPKNGAWNDAQWAKYLDYDDELDDDYDDEAAGYSVGNLRENAKNRRDRRRDR